MATTKSSMKATQQNESFSKELAVQSYDMLDMSQGDAKKIYTNFGQSDYDTVEMHVVGGKTIIDSEYRDVVWIDAKHPSKWESQVYEELGEAWKESETSNEFFKDNKNDFSILDKNQLLLDSIANLSVKNKKLEAINRLQQQLDSLKSGK